MIIEKFFEHFGSSVTSRSVLHEVELVHCFTFFAHGKNSLFMLFKETLKVTVGESMSVKKMPLEVTDVPMQLL